MVAQAQQKPSLRDLLYSGRLKADSNTVVRRSDDLTTKIDTATRKPAEPKPVTAAVPAAEQKAAPVLPDPANTTAATETGVAAAKPADSSATAETPAVPAPAPVKSNTRIWKEYSDSLISALKTEVLSSKKVKKETYYVIAEYEIGTEGQVTVLNVTASPENAFLQDEIKNRMSLTAPQLAPVLDSTGKPRKVKRKYSFSVTKE